MLRSSSDCLSEYVVTVSNASPLACSADGLEDERAHSSLVVTLLHDATPQDVDNPVGGVLPLECYALSSVDSHERSHQLGVVRGHRQGVLLEIQSHVDAGVVVPVQL